jgi:hypothetical protein
LPWDQCNLVDIWIRNPHKFESRHFVLQIINYEFLKLTDLMIRLTDSLKKTQTGRIWEGPVRSKGDRPNS